MKEDNLLPKCLVCGYTPEGGIKQGILCGGKFLCSSCEEEIAQLSIEDDDYSFYSDKLKQVWY